MAFIKLKKMVKIIQEHITKEKLMFETIYVKRIIYEHKETGILHYIKFRVDKKEFEKTFK